MFYSNQDLTFKNLRLALIGTFWEMTFVFLFNLKGKSGLKEIDLSISNFAVQ